jgi:HEAT repeat protein
MDKRAPEVDSLGVSIHPEGAALPRRSPSLGFAEALLCSTALLVAGHASAQDWLSELSGPRARDALSSPDPDVRLEAARQLGSRGSGPAAVDALTAALGRETSLAVQREIALALARRGDDRATQSLAVPLTTAGNFDRTALARAIAAFGTRRAASTLVEALANEDARQAALDALPRMGSIALAPLVRASREPALRRPAIEALGRLGDVRATELLVEALDDPDSGVREAALQALARLADERAAPAVARLLADPDVRVRYVAVETIAEVGTAPYATLVEPLLAHEDVAFRRAALETIAALDAGRASELLGGFVNGEDEAMRVTARNILFDGRDPRYARILAGLLSNEADAPRAATALAELEAGAGVPELVLALRSDRADTTHLSRELAIALRKWSSELSRSTRSDALEALEARVPGSVDRRLLLLALARDPSVRDDLVRALGHDDPLRRAASAHALGFLDDAGADGAIRSALVTESDAEAFRRLASLAIRERVRVEISALQRFLANRETKPDAMCLAALAIEREPTRASEGLRMELRSALRDQDPRTRAAAARALAIARDRSAWRALVTRLDDGAPEVRLAAALALEALDVAEARDALLASARVEDDPGVLGALLDAAEPTRRRQSARRGGEIFRARVVAEEAEAVARVTVDIVLPDGEWLRIATLETGEIVIADLPAGTADLRVRVGQ